MRTRWREPLRNSRDHQRIHELTIDDRIGGPDEPRTVRNSPLCHTLLSRPTQRSATLPVRAKNLPGARRARGAGVERQTVVLRRRSLAAFHIQEFRHFEALIGAITRPPEAKTPAVFRPRGFYLPIDG